MEGLRTGPGWDDDASMGTAKFILTYMTNHKDAYAQEVWRSLKDSREVAPREIQQGKRVRKYTRTVTSYNNFLRNYWEPLIKMKMVVATRKERSDAGPTMKPWERKFYKLAANAKTDNRWNNIQKAYRLSRGWGTKEEMY